MLEKRVTPLFSCFSAIFKCPMCDNYFKLPMGPKKILYPKRMNNTIHLYQGWIRSVNRNFLHNVGLKKLTEQLLLVKNEHCQVCSYQCYQQTHKCGCWHDDCWCLLVCGVLSICLVFYIWTGIKRFKIIWHIPI